MLRLRNIKIKNNIAEADIFPEDKGNGDHIIVNLTDKEIVLLENSDKYEFTTYPVHALYALIEAAQDSDKKDERLIMWY